MGRREHETTRLLARSSVVGLRDRQGLSAVRPAALAEKIANHSQVLLCIARDPGIRPRDVAERVGITERPVQRIVIDLVEGGFVKRGRVGRRSRYAVDREARMRHPAQFQLEVGELLDLLELDPTDGRPAASKR